MAQLVAHPLDVREVTSSSLVSSTTATPQSLDCGVFAFVRKGRPLTFCRGNYSQKEVFVFMGGLFETGMLLCFGASWPFNIVKSYRSRTAGGKSLIFQLLVIAGYLLGIAGKIVTHNVNYVLAVYILDLAMVSVDLVLTLRNKKLDRMAAAQG